MKAIRVHETGGPEVMKLEEVAGPKVAAGQIVVQIKAVGVNPVETYVRAGTYPMRAALPYTPGADAAGIVQSVASDVRKFKPGDRVYLAGSVTGTYAELALAHQSQAHRLPDSVTFQQGAAIGIPYATAWRALFLRTRAMPGETILIHGASGGVGIAAVQIAKSNGLTVFGTAGSDRGMQLVAEQGADHILNHTEKDYLDKLQTLTNGRGVDLILEMLANVNLNNDLDALAKKGRVVVIGSRGPIQIDARRTMSKDTSILGMSLLNATPEELTTIHSALGAGLSNATLRPVIGHEIPLRDAPRSHELVMNPGSHGKIVLIP